MRNETVPAATETSTLNRFDILWVSNIGAVSAAVIFLITSRLAHEIVGLSIEDEGWFQGDGRRIFGDMVSFGADHWRAHLRPLFSLITIPSTGALMAVFGLSPMHSVWAFNACCCGAWASTLFLTLRALGLRALNAAALTCLAICGAAPLYWFIVPETYGLSSLFLTLAFLVAAVDARRRVGNLTWIAVGGLVTCTLISNWSAIVALSFVLKNRRDAILISIGSMALFVCALGLQRVVFPHPGGLGPGSFGSERRFLMPEKQGGPSCTLKGEFITPLLITEAKLVGEAGVTPRQLTVQCNEVFTLSGRGTFPWAVALWLSTLAWGCVSIFLSSQLRRYGLAVVMALGAQVVLHLFYGEETFLYALHFLPMLILLASGVLISDRRRLALLAILTLTVLAGMNNGQQLVSALKTHFSGTLDQDLVKRIGL